MNILIEATMLNNEGARLLQAGHAMGALHLLQNAVHIMKDLPRPSIMMHAHHHNTDNNYHNANTSSSSSVSSPRKPLKGILKKTVCDMESSSCEVDGLLYVYNRPLFISTSASITSSEQLDAFVETLSTYIIFNFALACHQYGTISGTDAPIQRAMELYDLLIRTLSRIVSTVSKSSNHPAMSTTTYITLQCLALNNLAQLHYDQCEYEDSQYCMECMTDLLEDCATVLDSNLLNTMEAEELMLNPVYLQPPTAACAA